jgi:hypothetical protein
MYVPSLMTLSTALSVQVQVHTGRSEKFLFKGISSPDYICSEVVRLYRPRLGYVMLDFKNKKCLLLIVMGP